MHTILKKFNVKKKSLLCYLGSEEVIALWQRITLSKMIKIFSVNSILKHKDMKTYTFKE